MIGNYLIYEILNAPRCLLRMLADTSERGNDSLNTCVVSTLGLVIGMHIRRHSYIRVLFVDSQLGAGLILLWSI